MSDLEIADQLVEMPEDCVEVYEKNCYTFSFDLSP